MSATRIVTGTLSELETAFSDAVEAARPGDPLAPLTVLVGQSLLKRYLPRMLAARGVALINVRFVLAHELALSLTIDAGAPAKPRLSRQAEQLLVREIAEDARGYFADIARGDGFADALGRLFRELDMGGFADPSALEDALAGLEHANSAKFQALTDLYRRYLARRAAFATQADDYRLADAAAFEGELLIYGLVSPSELQARLIERIATQTRVTAFVPIAEHADNAASTPFLGRLRAFAAGRPAGAPGPSAPDGARAGRPEQAQLSLFDASTAASEDAATSVPRARVASTLSDSNALERCVANLFAPASGVPVAAPVQLLSAPDTVREVWEAARTCLAWAAEGIRFHEMAIVYRNADPYRALVDEIFTEAGIETYLHDGRLFSTHPLGLRLLALLDLAGDVEFSRRNVMGFLTETRIPRETRERHPELRPTEWETYTREAGVVAGIDQWRRRLGRLAIEKRARAAALDTPGPARAADRIDALIAFVGELHDALTNRPETATWEEHLLYVRALAARYSDRLSPLIEALDDLKTLSAVTESVTFAVFCRAVRDDLESRDTSRALGTPVREFGKKGVAVVDATSLRHLRFRAVYMLGVAERAWPPPPRPDPLLLEHERRALNAREIGTLPLRTEPDESALTFWLDAQAARERLAISYSRADAGSSGKHLPSYFFRAVASALAGERVDLRSLDSSPHLQRIEAGRLASSDLKSSLSDAEYDRGLVKATVETGDTGGIGALSLLDEARWRVPWFARAITSRQQRWSNEHNPYAGVMCGEAALAETAAIGFATRVAVSPSRLEKYAACPQSYFMKYVLRIDAIDEPEATERINPMERGSLVHAILERFLGALWRDDPPRASERARHLELLQAVAETECRIREEAGSTGRPLIWAMDQQQIREDLVRWYDLEVKDGTRNQLRPGAFEASFGIAQRGDTAWSPISRDKPLVIRVDERDLQFQGRIDRIDWDEAREHFRVIDYKTGSMHGKVKATFDKGRAMQLPIYLRAAASLLDTDPASGEAQYFYVSSKGGFKRKRLEGDTLAVRDESFEQVLTTVVDGVDGGFFAPNPGTDRANCMWCDYKDSCDGRVDRIAQRKQGDPRGAAFAALQAVE